MLDRRVGIQISQDRDPSDKETSIDLSWVWIRLKRSSACWSSKECEIVRRKRLIATKDLGITEGAFFSSDSAAIPPLQRINSRGRSICPVCTLMPYSSQEEAIQIAAMGKGSL